MYYLFDDDDGPEEANTQIEQLRTPKAIRVEYSGEAVQLLFNFDVQTIMCVVYIVNEHREANKTKLTECAALNESANWDSVCLRAFFYGAILFVPISFLSLPVRQLINFFLLY